MLVASPRKSVHHDGRRYGFFPQVHKRLDSWSGLNWTPWEGPSIKHQLESLQTSDAIGRKPESELPNISSQQIKLESLKIVYIVYTLLWTTIHTSLLILGKVTSLEGLQKGGLFQSFHYGSPSPRSLADKAGAFCSMICSKCKMVLNCTPKTNVKNTTCPIKLLEFAAETTSTSPNGANENLNIYRFGSSWWAPQALCETHTCTPQMPPRKCTCKRFPFGTSST